MPALPCANHPKEMTLVRCGRCEKPICVRCMVDTPVGKKCPDCARNRNHITESTPRHVLLAFLAATAVAVPAGWVLHQLPMIIVLAFIYGGLVAEVALRAGQRRRSLAMQVAAGLAALIGGLVGSAVILPHGGEEAVSAVMFVWPLVYSPFSLAVTVIGVVAAVSRVRYL
jgi:hypothetical protein